MLLFAYTPRQPSVGTENMLRCAYRAGLRKATMLDNIDGSWKMGNGDASPICDINAKTLQRHLDSPSNNDAKGDVISGSANREQQRRAGCPGTLAPAPVTPVGGDGASEKSLSRNMKSASGRPRPVLLAFGLSPGSSQRDTLSAESASKDIHPSQACCSESAWLRQWEYVFPGISRWNTGRKMSRGVLATACLDEPDRASHIAGGEGKMDKNNEIITAEYLWGCTA